MPLQNTSSKCDAAKIVPTSGKEKGVRRHLYTVEIIALVFQKYATTLIAQ